MSGKQFSLKNNRAIRPAISNQNLFSATNQFAVNSRIGLIKVEGLQGACVAKLSEACGVADLENDWARLIGISRAWICRVSWRIKQSRHREINHRDLSNFACDRKAATTAS